MGDKSRRGRVSGVQGLRIGIVGATGMVGAEILDVLEARRFPIGELLPFSSGRALKSVRFRGKNLPAPSIDLAALSACDLVLFAGVDDVSRSFARKVASSGVWVIDDSPVFRMDSGVPLIIPEVNARDLSRSRRLITSPNCTMTGLAVAGFRLHQKARVREVRVSSYQSVSGAGRSALEEFFSQTHAFSKALRSQGQGRAPLPRPTSAAKVLPAPIAGNVYPQVGSFDSAGHTSEETKIGAELRKIWGAPAIKVSATAVRVPVVRGHSLSVWLKFERPLSVSAARRLIASQPGAVLLARDKNYPTPLRHAGEDSVYVGRVRQGVDDRELCLWIVSDNLLKGSALNSVQIAEELLRRDWL